MTYEMINMTYGRAQFIAAAPVPSKSHSTFTIFPLTGCTQLSTEKVTVWLAATDRR